jgi:hypothetical protein
VRSDAKLEGAYEQLLTSETLGSILKGDGEEELKMAFRRSYASDNVSFLSNIVARTDLTEDSRIKQIVSRSINIT